jgi:hypothetical protein
VAISPTSSRLNLFRDWKNDLPLKFLWTVNFTARETRTLVDIGNNINRVLAKYERSEGSNANLWRVNTKQLAEQSDSSNNLGLLVAQNIAFPNESFGISTQSTGNMGGFIQGYVGNERNPYGSSNKIDITFLETNIDIVDYFIKPWIIASSHRGLIEDNNTLEDIKCNITVVMYTRDKSSYTNTSSVGLYKSRLEPRKQIDFFNAVPFNVAGDEVSYGELSESDWKKTVSFAFSHYAVRTPDGVDI